MLPRQDEFFVDSRRTPGEKRTQYIFDSTPQLALEKFGAIMESQLTPRTERWHRLESSVPELNDDHEVKLYFDQVTDILFKLRYASTANYASQQHETYLSLGCFGTGVLMLEDDVGRGFRYKSSHISEHFFTENNTGLIENDYRRFRLTAKQAAEKYGEDNLPDVIQRSMQKEPFKKHDFLHVVIPNDEYIPGSVSPKHYKYKSFHISIEGKKLLSVGGFRTFPFIISRYITSPNETYGRSPGMTALAEAKMLMQMRKTDLRARHLAIDPPILTAHERSVRKLNMKPNAVNYGTLDANGNPLVRPYQNAARIDVSNDALAQSREVINDVFMVKLFQILVETPQMTATEVLQRAQEKGALIAPTVGRQQSEALSPMIEREIDIASFAGLLPEMPDSLKEAEGEFEIRYTSPLSKLQKTETALSAKMTLESVLPLIEIQPDVLDNFDLDAYADIVHDANAAPARLMRDPDQIEALRKAREEQQQLQALAGAAPDIAGSIKDIAQAQSFAE